MRMIEIEERITRMTRSSGATTPPWPPGAASAPTGTRVTLEFTRTVPLSSGQTVRLRYDLTGDGRIRDCVGVAKPTHIVARPGRMVLFHYRMSQWIAQSDMRA
jgi:hypothetical protein